MSRFRARLVEHDPWERLPGEANRQLKAKRVIMTEGRINIIYASPVEAARSGPGKDGRPTRDPEAGRRVKNDSQGRKKATYGYSVHTGADEDGFVPRQTGPPAAQLSVIRRKPNESTRSVWPGWTSVVAVASSTTNGPTSVAPAGSLSRS